MPCFPRELWKTAGAALEDAKGVVMAIRWAGARWRQLFQEPTLCVSYINGMLTSERDALEHTQHISAAFAGRTVHAFWNPTAGAYADLVKTANLKLRGADYPEVDGLTRHLRECVASLHDGSSRPGRVLHLAHSQGALITHLAAKQLTCAEKRQIEVVTFGAAQSIDASDGFRRSVNYFAMNDPVLYLDQSAARAWSGLDKAAIDRVMASGDPERRNQEAMHARQLEELLQQAAAQRQWTICLHIQAALDALNGRICVPITKRPRPVDGRGSHTPSHLELLSEWTGSVRLSASHGLFPCGEQAAIVFCKPLTTSSLDAHTMLGKTYSRQLEHEAQQVQRQQLASTDFGRLRLLLPTFSTFK